MGRSVSCPANTVAKYYIDFDMHMNTLYAGCFGITPSAHTEEDWDIFLEDLMYSLQTHYPSMRTCNVWLGNEDRAILQNDYAYMGVSEYCGVVCVWVAMKELDCYYAEDVRVFNLAHAWVNRIRAGFEKRGNIRRIGGMSNGEGVYERVTA